MRPNSAKRGTFVTSSMDTSWSVYVIFSFTSEIVAGITWKSSSLYRRLPECSDDVRFPTGNEKRGEIWRAMQSASVGVSPLASPTVVLEDCNPTSSMFLARASRPGVDEACSDVPRRTWRWGYWMAEEQTTSSICHTHIHSTVTVRGIASQCFHVISLLSIL